MDFHPEARLDKWLWAARLYKTRSLAAEACKSGRVTVGGANAKPARIVKAGEDVSVRRPPITYTYRVLNAIEVRVGAKLIPEVYEDVTDPAQLHLLEMTHLDGFTPRARGTGRPTKKDRRDLNAFLED